MAQDLRTLLQTAKAENPDALRDPAIRERVAELHMQIDFDAAADRAGAVEGAEGREGLARSAAREAAVGLHLAVARRARARRARPDRRAAEGRARRVDGGMWARNYVWQRYTTIGAGPTEVQKNIIADRALKLER